MLNLVGRYIGSIITWSGQTIYPTGLTGQIKPPAFLGATSKNVGDFSIIRFEQQALNY